jgi:ABC-2 type transport system permease protein
VGIAILGGVLPLLYPERGTQMTFMMQAVILLISGVYYSVDVLPGWLRVFSTLSPATYILDGMRGALIDGESLTDLWDKLLILAGFGVVLIPASILLFSAGEHWAKKTGKLKRQG